MQNIKATVGPAQITSVIEDTLDIDADFEFTEEIDLDLESILTEGTDFIIPQGRMVPTLHVYKLWETAHLPEYGSEWAACFDLKAGLRDGDNVRLFTPTNGEKWRKVVNNKLVLNHRERMLVPTGLVFDLDPNTSLRIHPRSGLALKNGIIVANCEGVVDADYVQQTYVMLYNISGAPFIVTDGDRIAQGEVVPLNQTPIVLADREPGNKTSRSGGFGSTGV